MIQLRFSKKLIYVLLLMLTALLVSCTSQSPQQTKQPKGVTLIHYFSGAFSSGLDELVLEFNGRGTDNELKAIAVDHEAFKSSILKSLKEKNPPEVYSYWAGSRTQAIKDHLKPLDEIWESNNLNGRFKESLVESASMIDGRYYLLPITQHYVTIFYNKRVFEQLNLEVPINWSDFLALCQHLKDSDIIPIGLGSKQAWPAQFWFDYLLLRSESYSLRTDLMEGRIPYNHPAILSVFEKWSSMIESGFFVESPNAFEWSDEPLKGLAEGKIAMTLMGTWAISTLENEYKLVPGVDYDVFDFPVIDENLPKVALGPVDGLVVPKDSVNPQGALDVLAFFAEASSQKNMAFRSGALSPSTEVDRSAYGYIQQKIYTSIDDQELWAFNYDLATQPDVANLGLQLLTEFLYFPQNYSSLLDEVTPKVKMLFK
jgi:ABC-type glycerol-3-phosphate transport system substrate-binding protein